MSCDGHEIIDFPVLYTPYYVDTRMSAQGSFFLVWGAKKEPFEVMISGDNYMEIPDSNVNKSETWHGYGLREESDILFKFIICSDRKQFLLHELDRVGINEKTLFPGLDGIGRYIERQYRFDPSEALLP